MTLFFIGVATGNLPILLRLLHFFPSNDSHLLVPILILDQVVTGILGIAEGSVGTLLARAREAFKREVAYAT